MSGHLEFREKPQKSHLSWSCPPACMEFPGFRISLRANSTSRNNAEYISALNSEKKPTAHYRYRPNEAPPSRASPKAPHLQSKTGVASTGPSPPIEDRCFLYRRLTSNRRQVFSSLQPPHLQSKTGASFHASHLQSTTGAMVFLWL